MTKSNKSDFSHEMQYLYSVHKNGQPMDGCFGPVSMTWIRPAFGGVRFLLFIDPLPTKSEPADKHQPDH
jgi:hypothetical protein